MIIDYIWDQKYHNHRANSNFSMKGRTATALLRQAEAWREALDKVEGPNNLRWPHSDIGEFYFEEGNEQDGNMKRWYIRELLSTAELIKEGHALMHCLRHYYYDDFSYAKACYIGEASIWSMEMQAGEEKRRKILTIKVSQDEDKNIHEISGRQNRQPTPEELRIIEKWADAEDLELDSERYL